MRTGRGGIVDSPRKGPLRGTGLTAALAARIVNSPAHAQHSWDLAKCQASAQAGHLCTPEHLETDLALLTVRAIADFLDPEIREAEVVRRRDPQMHLMNPEALPDPRTDPSHIQILHAWAETGVLESDTAARQDAARATTGTVTLQGISSLSVTIEQPNVTGGQCVVSRDSLQQAAVSRLLDAGTRAVSDTPAPPMLDVNVTTLSFGAERCAALVSVALRAAPDVAAGYHPFGGRKLLEDGSLLASSASDVAERIAIKSAEPLTPWFVGSARIRCAEFEIQSWRSADRPHDETRGIQPAVRRTGTSRPCTQGCSSPFFSRHSSPVLIPCMNAM